MLDLILIQVAVVTLYASLWFLVALKLRRNDVADVAWGAGFIILALVGQFVGAAISNRGILVLALVTIWGLRLPSPMLYSYQRPAKVAHITSGLGWSPHSSRHFR